MYHPPPPQRAVLGEKDANCADHNNAVTPDHSPKSTATQTAGDENAIPKATKATKDTKDSTKLSKLSKKNASKLLDVSEIHLEGEETGDVPIFDTCDEVRRKIRAFLKKDGVTQAALLRAIGDCRRGSHAHGRSPISSSSFRMFMRQSGPAAGGNSEVHYAGYVFFEKVRLRDGKPKSKKREEMEQVWGKNGATLGGSRYVLCRGDEIPMVDKYGMTQFIQK
ncbi:hypothetical protein OQA88_614 [Cercophora sp. LCS_1]